MTLEDQQIEILIVEDSPTQALQLQMLLEAEGYRITVARDGVEGCDAASNGAFDLVISDVNMPRMNGFQMCHQLKEDPRTRYLPVIMLTDRHRIADLIQALEVGADNFVTKPYRTEELQLRVGRLLEDMAAWSHRRSQQGSSLLLPSPEEVVLRFEKAQILELLIASAQKLDEELETMAASFRMLTFDKSPDEIQDYLVERIAAISEAECTVMTVWDQQGPAPFARVQSLEKETVRAVSVALPQASVWLASEFDKNAHAAPLLELEMAAVPAMAGLAQDCGLVWCLAAPLVGHGRVIGAIMVFYRIGQPPSQDGRRRFSNLANLAMVILENRHLLHLAHDANRQLEEALIELKAMQSRIIQQERLRALGQMASGIAHDFNNALSPVIGFAELLLTVPGNLEDRDKTRRYLELIQTGAGDAANVVRRLREFYRQDESEKTIALVDITQLVAQAIAFTEPKWKSQAMAKGAEITVQVDFSDVPPVPCNESAIRELLLNLIINAVDAMPDGGTLSLRGHTEGNDLVMEISDTGLGMPEDVQKHCFEPFFTTKGVHGTGLGLAMVYGIVQRHKGSIEVHSAAGKGTTFRLRLPLQRSELAELDTEAAPQPAVPSRVLVVDDEPLVREYIRESLSLDGHVVDLASNGTEGLEAFRGGNFDLVITDLAMPGMNGGDLAGAIKALSPETPVILLSGFGDLMEAREEKPAGADLIVGKPVQLAALRKALAQALSRKPAPGGSATGPNGLS